MIRLLIADDHQLFIDGLTSLLRHEPQLAICGQALNGQQVLQQLALQPVDILLLDINMPDTDVVALTRQIRQQFASVKIIVLTMYHGTRYYIKLLRYINGYLYKSVDKSRFLAALQRVQAGEVVISEEVLADTSPKGACLPVCAPDGKAPQSLLTRREQQVLALIVQQHSNRQIGELLCLSTGTVDTHRKNILLKLGVKNTVGLIQFALLHNLLPQLDSPEDARESQL